MAAAGLLMVLSVRFSVPAADVLTGFLNSGETTPFSREETVSDEEPVTQSEVPSAYETPEDILRMQDEFAASHENAPPAGTVTESTFVKEAATDSVGNVHIRNATAALRPDFAALLAEGSDLTAEDGEGPLVLIFHTHTTESYLLNDDGKFYEDYQTKSTDEKRNMLRVGDEICRVLDERSVRYIHLRGIYDEPYTGAYARSRADVEKILKEEPGIKIVLDVHRDAVYYSDSEHGKQVCRINGRKAAQIMTVTGAEDGTVTDFPDWEYNLRFALELQKKAQEKYEGLMRPVYFCPRRYNMDTAHCSLLLEIGSDANTLEEAVYSAHLLGDVLADLIEEHS